MAKTRRIRRRHRGAGKIGEGVSGTVYQPPLPCTDGTEVNTSNESMVGKLVDERDFKRELDASLILKELDPQQIFTIRLANFCRIGSHPNNPNFTHQLVYPYGGISLAKAAEDLPTNLKPVFKALKEFLPYLIEFNRSYIHNDLHLDNLVILDGDIRMIDFATMIWRTGVFAQEKKRIEEDFLKKGVPIHAMEPLREYIQSLAETETNLIDVERLYRNIRKVYIDTPEARETLGKAVVEEWLATYPKVARQPMDAILALQNLPA